MTAIATPIGPRPGRSKPPRRAPSDGVLLTVDRGLQVLRAFRCDRTPLSNAELVRRTGLSKATVSRLTTTLMQVGYLRHAPDGRQFELAPGPVGIGHAYLAGSDLAPTAGPVLQELADALDVSAALAVGHEHEMVYVACKAGRQLATLRMGVGSVLPMGTSAMGHAYLHGLEPERREAVVGELLAQTSSAPDLRERLQRSFAQLDEGGSCSLLGIYPGSYGVACPVKVGAARTTMALSCGRVVLRPDVEAERSRITPRLVATARRLERVLARVHIDG